MGTEGELLRRIQAALARADLEADALVDEAWDAARVEVRTVLQRALQQELLDRVAHVLEGGPPRTSAPEGHPATEAPAPETAEPARPSPAATGIGPNPGPGTGGQAGGDGAATYIFGITRTTVALDPDLPRVPGGGPVRAVDHGDLRAVVCDAQPDAMRALEDLGPDDLDHLATLANAHDEVLARVAAQAPVLPLRLGTLLGDDPTVRALLVANGEVLGRELARVAGHAEWAVVVRVTDRPQAESHAAEAKDGAEYLRARREALAAREHRWASRDQLAADVHERLAGFAVDAATVDKRPLERVPPALHGVYLLPWDRIDAFEDAVDAARAAHPDAIIEASGPWPPYHFTSVDLTLTDERPS